jgi:hypothetical protein
MSAKQLACGGISGFLGRDDRWSRFEARADLSRWPRQEFLEQEKIKGKHEKKTDKKDEKRGRRWSDRKSEFTMERALWLPLIFDAKTIVSELVGDLYRCLSGRGRPAISGGMF